MGIGALFNILTNSVGSLFLGLLITFLGMALMFYIIKSWYKNSEFTPLSFIIGGVLFLILAFHAIIICGAMTIKSYGDDMEALVGGYVENLSDDTVLSQADTQAILDRMRDDLPLVGHYADYANFSGHTPLDIAESMNDEMQHFMNEYIVKHLLWTLFFIIVGAFCIIKTMEKGRGYGGRKVYTRAEEQF